MDAEIKQAYDLGVKAFRAGQRAIPAQDRDLLDMLKGEQIGEGVPLLKSWLKGWTTENLK